MKAIFAEQLNNQVLNALDDLERSGKEPILMNSRGQRFVILKEEDYCGWRETAYLLSSSKNSKVLYEALAEPLEKCRDLKDVLNELES
ncbi:MAG: hypothetical protein ABIF11_01590 [Nitrospirota bacterium]